MSRLDEIKFYTSYPKEEGNITTMLSRDVNFLIQKAGRAEELEKEIKSHAPSGRNYTNEQYVTLLQQNQRYRQALNKIANEMDGNLEGLDAERGLEEAKEIAEKALEDEK